MVCLKCYSQQALRFKTVSLFQGLSQSTVNAIVQDKQGFIWIGTQDGLNRYDGYNIKVYKHIEGNPNSLPDNFVQSLFIDKNGNLWIGTYGGGLSCLNPETGTFKNYQYTSGFNRSISSNQIMSICQDREGKVWIATGDGLNQLDPKTGEVIIYKNDPNVLSSISSNKTRSVFIDSKNRLWVGTADQGLNQFDSKTQGFIRHLQNKAAGLNNNFVQFISEFNSDLIICTSGGGVNIMNPETGTFTVLSQSRLKETNNHQNDTWTAQINDSILYVGTYGSGLLSYNLQTKEKASYTFDPSDPNSVSNNIILCSYKDRQGFIWLGTLGGGASYFDPAGAAFNNIRNDPSNKNSLNENVVMSIFEDEGDHKIYLGTYGGGLNIKDTKTGQFEVYNNRNSGLTSNIIRTITKDQTGQIWIGSYEGGLSEFTEGRVKLSYKNIASDPTTISNNDVWTVRADNKNNLWIGTWGGGLNFKASGSSDFTRYIHSSEEGSISGDKVISLLIDSKGRIWAGTNGAGLNCLEKGNKSFIQYRYSDKDSTSISSDRIRYLHEDKIGNIWIGTDGGGLNKLNKNGTFTRFTEKQGLPNNVIYSILEDDFQNLWLGTNNGLCRFNTQNFSVRNFDITDGMQGNEFNQAACFKNIKGTMYFGGIGGVTYFNPVSIHENKYIPPIVLTSIKLFGKELVTDSAHSYIDHLTFNYDQNFFSFEFSALDFTAPEKNRYSCKMEGFDKGWIDLGNKRFVSYTNLNPGEYIFKIRASNNEGKWNEEGIRIHVTITPPFYKTYWFYALVLAWIIGLIYLYIYLRTKKLREDKRTLENEVSQRTEEVVRQKEIIEGKNKDITDSINYARRIQQAIFPSHSELKKIFNQSFIIYKPKDIVSGDFYWMQQINDNLLLAVVDCTGHGVPGAFMSIVGNNLLNEAVNENKILTPAEILNEMNKGLTKLIRHHGEYELQDGMDIVLCNINLKEKTLTYSGANNPLWIVRNGSEVLEEIKPDKQPIGSYSREHAGNFTNHLITLSQGDSIYLFSDGYADQFGGEKGKKLKKNNLKKLILDISKEDMPVQREKLESFFKNWQGRYEQVDDVLVVGVRV